MVSRKAEDAYCTLKKRLEAVGKPCGDPIIEKLASEAESRYIPKRVLS